MDDEQLIPFSLAPGILAGLWFGFWLGHLVDLDKNAWWSFPMFITLIVGSIIIGGAVGFSTWLLLCKWVK